MIKAKKFVYVNRCDGIPTKDNIELREETLPPLKEGEFMAQAIYISVDPYQQDYFQQMELGDTMLGNQVAHVIQSKSSKFPRGTYVIGAFGWRTHTIVNENYPYHPLKPPPLVIPLHMEKWRSIPLSLLLGVLGMPGNVAYYAAKLAKIKPGEIIVITNAAGAVGYLAGQIARLRKCLVIGITNSRDKCYWLREIGFNYSINYKRENFDEILSHVAPSGIDCLIDGDGGEIYSKVISKMKRHGRIILYDRIPVTTNSSREAELMTDVVENELVVKRITRISLLLFWCESVTVNMQLLLLQGLRFRETKTTGFERMLDLLVKVLNQDTIGASILVV